MKIIDLLNKIADGGDVPKYIKPSWYLSHEYLTYDEETRDYYNKDCTIDLIGNICLYLNDEVEIIEDTKEDKKIKKLEEPTFNKGSYYFKDIFGDMSEISGIERRFRLKINEIIDKLNEGDK